MGFYPWANFLFPFESSQAMGLERLIPKLSNSFGWLVTGYHQKPNFFVQIGIYVEFRDLLVVGSTMINF
jgi:hypothetical protein